jgi:uncharacterized protein (TIGR02246 family)
MKRFATLCAAAAMTLTLTACNHGPNAHDTEVLKIQGDEMKWNHDYVSKDLDSLMAHYADDAVLIVPGTPALSGKPAIASVIKPMLSDPLLSLHFKSSKVEVSKSRDLAYTQGSYTLLTTDPQTKRAVNDHGSYVTTYRKQDDGSWKAVVDIITSDVPPPTPAPPTGN